MGVHPIFISAGNGVEENSEMPLLILAVMIRGPNRKAVQDFEPYKFKILVSQPWPDLAPV